MSTSLFFSEVDPGMDIPRVIEYIEDNLSGSELSSVPASRHMQVSEYAFNSKENFTRAFKNEHGMLTSEYRTANSSLRLYAPYKAVPVFPKA